MSEKNNKTYSHKDTAHRIPREKKHDHHNHGAADENAAEHGHGDIILETRGLKKYFATPGGQLHAVDDVDLKIRRGTTMGVVGESGCGKSTLGRTLIHLLESTDGNIYYNGYDITRVSKQDLRKLRHKMQIIFQDPNSSLDPRRTVESTIREPMMLSKHYNKNEMNDRVDELMNLVGVDNRMRRAYPHELDGGRRQRVGIARALAMSPEFVVCDEPVSALDVSIQAQILNLLQDLQVQQHLTYMFVTHDMSVVKHLADDICVMYLGQVVEVCPAKKIFERPLHPYTKVLLSAIPTTDYHDKTKRIITKGEITSPIDPKPGCRFANRCMYYREGICDQPQKLEEVIEGRMVSCCRAKEINDI